MSYYLGFDSGTQSLTATVIEITGDRRAIVLEHTVPFDDAFPEYGTTHGVLRSQADGSVVAPPAMWAAALDRAAGWLSGSGLDLSRIRAVAGSAQQHGSVYLAAGAAARLGDFDPARPLAEHVARILARSLSPVWLDASTRADCDRLTADLGGDAAVARLTGSRVHARFTAAQIRKFARADPEAYAGTERIHLVSSFMASLLAGRHAPLEPGDASGMNLMDLERRRWARAALDATAPDLEGKLPAIRPSWTVVGELSAYWQRRHGFGPARIVAWSGDNPSSLIGLGLVHPGHLGISLGTSDTVFGAIERPDPDPSFAGHVFGSPAGGYMALTCFSNGSLAREHIRDEHGLDWDGFSAALRATPAGNGGGLMLPWFVPETTPAVLRPAVQRYRLDPADGARNVRAVVEAQAMAMRLHSRWFAPRVETIRATGGASVNRDVLQVIADVFGADLIRVTPRNAASLGAALRAFHAVRHAEGDPVGWDDVMAGFTGPAAGPRVQPDPAATAAYAALLPSYEALEAGATG